jgi:hypothetical protein
MFLLFLLTFVLSLREIIYSDALVNSSTALARTLGGGMTMEGGRLRRERSGRRAEAAFRDACMRTQLRERDVSNVGRDDTSEQLRLTP